MSRFTHSPRPLLGNPISARIGQNSLRSQIRQIQRGVITITGATSATATIVSVIAANTVLKFLGSTGPASGAANVAFARLALTNATTVTATVDTSPGVSSTTVSFEVIEYYPGVLKSVQRGTITIGAGTATITRVDPAKTTLDNLGFTDISAGQQSTVCVKFVLTNATTVTMSTQDVSGQIGSYQVVEEY